MKTSIRIATLLSAALLCGNAFAEAVQVPRPVPYSDDGDIADNIKQECKLNEQLADFIQEYGEELGVAVEFGAAPLDNSKGRVLDIRITNAISMGNAFLGHQKATTAVGTLYENGAKVATFKARRHSMGGAFAGYKGSCSVLGRTVDALGEDIATWLKAPADGAKLGDF